MEKKKIYKFPMVQLLSISAVDILMSSIDEDIEDIGNKTVKLGGDNGLDVSVKW